MSVHHYVYVHCIDVHVHVCVLFTVCVGCYYFFFTFRAEGKVMFSCSVDGVVVLWSSSNQPYESVTVSICMYMHGN